MAIHTDCGKVNVKCLVVGLLAPPRTRHEFPAAPGTDTAGGRRLPPVPLSRPYRQPAGSRCGHEGPVRLCAVATEFSSLHVMCRYEVALQFRGKRGPASTPRVSGRFVWAMS